MINQVIARAVRPEVIALAEQMRTTQQREITQLNHLLSRLGSNPRLARGGRGGTRPAPAVRRIRAIGPVVSASGVVTKVR